jgi:hypothetical protein
MTTTTTTYSPDKAKRLIMSGKAHSAMHVTGSLDLRGTQIAALPDNLTVGGWLHLGGTQITALPEGLTVGGSLDLRGTQIAALPEGLTVGGSLDLRGTQIAALPEGLTVGEWLHLGGTQITALPEGLTVGGSLDLRGLNSLSVPTPWYAENGEATRRRFLAICPDAGYALIQTDTDRFSAGCRKNLTRAQALKHWSRTDDRAVLFTAAINAHVM